MHLILLLYLIAVHDILLNNQSDVQNTVVHSVKSHPGVQKLDRHSGHLIAMHLILFINQQLKPRWFTWSGLCPIYKF
ncbi:hypothetical protein M758_11G154700 [Ceratodon purpureus]|nr:hypothetical protein M758_11G154700 [Ceratodon purpureus]